MKISYEECQAIFQAGGLPLCETHYYQLSAYLDCLLEKNQVMNLTAITDSREVWAKHFLDSAVLLTKVDLPLGTSCIDVGTGAGFPGMVMGILRPDLEITLLDSLQKRIGFLEEVCEKLGLSRVRPVHCRAEDGARMPELREQFQFATARAVASLPVLAEYCLPFVAVGGTFAAMKGPGESAEDALAAAEKLGAELNSCQAYKLDGVGQRQVITFRKIDSTSKQYPRRGDKIKKAPL